MEKQHKRNGSSNKILKAVIAVTMTFQNHPFSPGRDHHHKSRITSTSTDQNNNATTAKWVNRPHHHHHGGGNKGFSGPMIPREARTDLRDGVEPTSPKISCMGQIKHKKNQIKKSKSKNKTMPLQQKEAPSSSSRDIIEVKKNNVSSKFHRLLFHVAKPKSATTAGRKSNASADHDAPNMGQMKRFSSGRDAFASFDWKAETAAAQEEMQIDDYYSDEERVRSDGEDDEEERIRIPFSAPMLIGGGSGCGVAHGDVLNLKPRKEINLWKRRTMAPPRPLQLDP